MDKNNFLSVSEINNYIKVFIENNENLIDIYVKGEISNYRQHPTGTQYFSLKDDSSKISVVLFKNSFNKLDFKLEDGKQILIHGKISVYAPFGTYQIIASEIIFEQEGLLMQRFLKLKEKLEKKGYFSLEHKKSIPQYPNKIGIITAKNGAAVHDILRTLNSRYPIASIYFFPCTVQGLHAHEELVKTLAIADNYGLDVIIFGRGGGSIEDLWSFNEEIVADAIYKCNTPIISAVGHQTDFTISDFTSDLRALTPTDGAIKATPNKIELLQTISHLKNTIYSSFKGLLDKYDVQLQSIKSSQYFDKPENIINPFIQRLDYQSELLLSAFPSILERTSHRLSVLNSELSINSRNIIHKNELGFQYLKTALDNLSPLKVLDRGYAIISKSGKIENSAKNILVDDDVSIKMRDGNITAYIKSVEVQNGK